MEKTIAKITKAELGFEDHGIFGFNIEFRLTQHMHQATGWYSLEGGSVDFIRHVLQAAGVERWDRLAGRTVFVLREDGIIKGIENLPTEPGNAFIFKEYFDLYAKKPLPLTERQKKLLAENPEFWAASVAVVVEKSEVGLVVFDEDGRHIKLDPAQIISKGA